MKLISMSFQLRLRLIFILNQKLSFKYCLVISTITFVIAVHLSLKFLWHEKQYSENIIIRSDIT